MLLRHCNYQILVLMLLSLVGWNRPSTPAVDCVRDKAKIVRTLISKKILPILYRYSVTMPEDCPFYPGHDLFGWHDKHKIKLYSTPSLGWKCGLCGSSFETEPDLDLHFDLEHSGRNDLQNKSVCLADYCDIMRCDVFESLLAYSKNSSSSDADFMIPGNQSDEPANWDQTCSENMQKKLKAKCTAIIKDCLSGLLIGLSIKDFQEVEDDLNNAICSYLTCQRYWEYSLIEEKRVPVLFYLVFGGTLALSAWMWHYFTWTYFSGSNKKRKSAFVDPLKESPTRESLEAMRDRMNRQERSTAVFPPRIHFNEYKGLGWRNKQYNRFRFQQYNDEYLLNYAKRIHHRDRF